MTNEEMKQVLAKNGLAEKEIEKVSEKFDAEKITEIVEAASTPKEAFAAIHAFYPELEVEALQEQMDFVQSQFEAAAKGEKSGETVELTEEELDMVSGGGLGDWFKKNWKKVAVGAAIVVGTALVCTGVGAVAGALITSTALPMTVGAIETVAVVTSNVATGVAIGAGIGAAIGTVCGVGKVIQDADQLPS